MATTTNLEPHGGWARQGALDAPEASERAKSFARARRHTVLVRVLRWGLPAIAVGVVMLYVGIVLQTMGYVEDLPQIDIPNIIPDQLAMDNPRYEGFNADGGSYVVTAETAVPNLSDMSQVKLNGIVGDLTDAKKVKTKLKATHGFYNTKTSKLELFDGIDVVSDNGMRVRLSRATVLPKTNVVVSKEPVVVELPTGTIRSNQMTLRNKTHEVTFLDKVTAHLVPEESDTPKAPAKTKDAVPLLSAGNGPLDITANRLDIDDGKKVAVFSGKVRAVQGGAALETAALEVVYESKDADAKAKAAPGGGANIARITSRSPVVMTRAPQDRVTSRSLDFDAKAEVAVLNGDVVMTSGAERRVSGDVATINQRDDTILMTGNVIAIQGRNRLKGERLFVERATGRTQLSSPGRDGRIETRFFRGEALKGKAQQVKEKVAQAATAVGVFKTDPNAPIDVEADRLDVDDRAKTAVFKGDVRAAQGDFVVRTAKLTASYSGQAGLAEETNANTKKQSAQLNRLQARGKVIVTSKDGQRATGDWADFDVKSNKVVLGGDVVLTQGKNVVRGTQLDIDMLTGESIIHNDAGAAWSAKAAPDGKKEGFVVKGPLRGGRPSAIFYPRTKKSASKKGSAAAKKSQPQPEVDGWQARSQGN